MSIKRNVLRDIESIVNLNQGIRDFWFDAHGWAPVEAAGLLKKSRLDWQVSLSQCLRIWLKKPSEDQRDGMLILAWTNLGSLVEGTLKLFLSVWYEDYKNDIEAIKRKSRLVDPDRATLEKLRIFFKRKIWKRNNNWDLWIQHIQEKRNTIHAFRNRKIGSFNEFYSDIRIYYDFLSYINDRLLYPDDKIYKPR